MSFLNLEGAYENELAATGEFNPQAPNTALRLPSGQRVVLPTEVLLAAMSGAAGRTATRASSAANEAELGRSRLETPNPVVPAEETAGNGQVIPLVAEELLVGKTLVETARVRLRRETEEHTQTVNVPLTETRWEVERLPVEQVVDAQPEIRQVGETIIFPLVEERLVVKRELWLREEVHVRKVTSMIEKSAEFAVKRDVLVEERSDPTQR